MKVTAACDFFIVPTVTFRSLLAFVVLNHDRRRIVHPAVTPKHLEQALCEYVAYYYQSRPHLSLEMNSPERRRQSTCAPPNVHAQPVLGGLHHHYRAAS
ncbi:MAG: hypothetical protein DHS20C15_24220 [Planctomycetota bacterium]|nr:MAG: hypothetical protein DHS20C15_24220 [Planctomycetota bacterium]